MAKTVHKSNSLPGVTDYKQPILIITLGFVIETNKSEDLRARNPSQGLTLVHNVLYWGIV